MTERSKATDRLMSVFMMVAEFGPVSLADLTRMTFLPRSSVHRAAQALQAKGWIRARMSDHAYEVTKSFQSSLQASSVTVRCVDMLDGVIRDLAKSLDLTFEVGAFTDMGIFDGIDTTEYKYDLETHQSLTGAPSALFAQLALPPEKLIKHLDGYIQFATDTEKYQITSGRHRTRLADIRKTGHRAIAPYMVFPFSVEDTGGYAEYGSVLVKRPFRASPAKGELETVYKHVWNDLRRTSVNFTELSAP